MVDVTESLKAAARLREARKRAGFADAKDAAAHFGWSYDTYKAHELGKNRPLSKDGARRYADGFQKIAATKEVTAGWLLLGENPPSWGPEEHKPAKKVAIRTVPKVTYTQALKLGKARTVESMGVVAIGADPDLGPRAVALDIVGESMVAKPPTRDNVSFQPGDTIIVDPDVPFKPGDYVIAAAPGYSEAIFRKYRSGGSENGKEVVVLSPLNEDYNDIAIPTQAAGRVLAKMVRHIRKF